jgi:polyadenylation factor subunit 2
MVPLNPPNLLSSKPREAVQGEWRPTKYLTVLQPPPPDVERLEQELAAQKLGMDGKAMKKAKPRRTVDFTGGMGRYDIVRRIYVALYHF